ncbi:MAG TPA: iron ABC transporter permease [Micropepsaceae bacterium]|nr:iron ABC transporter permease [Micropepsaceae bacterium]
MSRSSTVSVGLFALVCALTIVSLLAGRVWLTPSDIVAGIFSPNPQLAGLIVGELRLPRAVLGLIVGGALGLAGAVLQGLTRNPLAEPGLLGVSAGAALGAVIAIYFGIATTLTAVIPLFGLAGAFGAMLLTFALGRGGGMLPLILAGAAVSGLASALISFALNLAPSPYAAYEIMTWLLGSLADRSWDHVLLASPFIAAGTLLLALTGRALDALALGEAQAESLGIDLKRLNLQILLGTALAVGAATAVTGAIGFVGLVAPHLVRPLLRYQPSRILLPASLAGAALLLAADIATRLITIGPEMKLGVFTSLIGTPFFFWLVVRIRRASP